MALVSRQLMEGLAAMGVRLTPENEKLLRETDNTRAIPRRVT